MTLQQWAQVGGAAVALTGGAYGAWRKYGRAWKLNLRRKASKRRVDENARIFVGTRHLIREWRTTLGAQRVLALSARNNGKPWPPDSVISVSCLDQSVAAETENTWSRWQDFKCDVDYREILYDLIQAETRGSILIASTMPHSVLRDAYEAQGTVASVVFPIHWILEDNALIYASVNFGRDVNGKPLDDDERHDYERLARDLFNEPDKIRRMAMQGYHLWKQR